MQTISWRSLILISLLLATRCFGAPAASPSGWVSLFYGKSLDNWVIPLGIATYHIEGDMIVGVTGGTKNPGTQTYLCTRRDYSDFELELDVLCDKALNSGIQIRSHVYEKETPTSKRTRRKGEVYGYQCEIAEGALCTSGNFQDEARGYIWYDDLTKKPGACEAFKDDAWNHFRIVAQGDHIRSWVNGVACADFHDSKDASGLIGLQVHTPRRGTTPLPLRVRFKNIRLRELKADEKVN